MLLLPFWDDRYKEFESVIKPSGAKLDAVERPSGIDQDQLNGFSGADHQSGGQPDDPVRALDGLDQPG